MSDRYPHLEKVSLAVRRMISEIFDSAPNPMNQGDYDRLSRAALDAIPSRKWFIGMTKDQQELKAAAALREQKYTVYLPRIFTRWQEGRKIEARVNLRFTGYVFVACGKDEHGPIRNTEGMDGSNGSPLIMGAGGNPYMLPPVIIDKLRSIEDDEFARAIERRKPNPRTDLVAGQQVEINKPLDPFHGKRGTYLGSERGVATVLLGFMAKEVPDCDLKKPEPEERAA